MRGPGERAEKYKAKVHGAVIPGQKKRFRGAVGDQIEAELFVKGLNVPALYQNYYMIFAKQVMKIRQTHSGNLAQDEVCVAFERWDSRGLTDTVLDSIVTHYNFESCITPAPPTCAWDFKMKITFSGNISATNLDDFPVLVHLTAGNFDFNHAQNNGEDIRFMDSDTCPTDGTPLKHEIEKWDKAGTDALIWVNVPRIDGGSVIDFIYMFFDNGVAPDGQDVSGTWNNNYAMVHHLYDDPNVSSITDSTSNNNDGAKRAANEPIEAAARVGLGQEFDGINDYINCPNTHTFDGPTITAEIWVKPKSLWSAALATHKGLVVHHAANGFLLIYNAAGFLECNWLGPGGWSGPVTFVTNLSSGTWYYLVVVLDPGFGGKLYIDGVWKATAAGTGPMGADINAATILSSNAGLATWWADEFADEMRGSTAVRTDDWIMATYRTIQETLITFGAEQPS